MSEENDYRINQFIAKTGFCSRRRADTFIKDGLVQVNGQIITDLSFRVLKSDKVTVCGKEVFLKRLKYLIINKPYGVVTTRADKHAERKITDLLPEKLRSLFPVGRLDKDSTGLIIMTNDGSLCHKITHPKYEIEKEYNLVVEGKFSRRDCRGAILGIEDQGDFLKAKAVVVESHKPKLTRLSVIVSEGKNRHIRRLFAGLGFKVLSLKRVRIADLTLGRLKESEFLVLPKSKIYRCLFQENVD
ncbi:MAG: pseudouridine synthase [Candidatus Omnitrophica bacterium]|nr:pseudouridine synthase [Candidatus Omnitrophota bacterium]